MEIDERALAAKFEVILPHLDERQRRLLLAAEARSLGYGGVSLVAQAAGVSRVTVTAGVDELEAGTDPMPGRARRPGGGRVPLTEADPELLDALDALAEPETRGDPMTRCGGLPSRPATWPGAGRQGHQVSQHSVGGCWPGRWVTACRPTPRPSRASSTRTVTPSSATSTPGHRVPSPPAAGDQRGREEEGTDRRVRQARGATGARPGTRAGPKSMTSPASRARPSPTASTTWAQTRAGSTWAATTTPPSSPSRPSADGGTASARGLPRPRRS